MIDEGSGMTPHQHIHQAEQLLGEAQAYGVDGGYDPTRVAAAHAHVAIAMFLRMEPAVDIIVDAPQYEITTRRKEAE